MKNLLFFGIFLFALVTQVSSQTFLSLNEMLDIYNTRLALIESKLIKKGFILANKQSNRGQKTFGRYYKRYPDGRGFYIGSIRYSVSSITTDPDPLGSIHYQVRDANHFANLKLDIDSKTKHLGTYEFSGTNGMVYDFYEGKNYFIRVFSKPSRSFRGVMIGHISVVKK